MTTTKKPAAAAERVVHQRLMPERRWSAQDVADFLGCSAQWVYIKVEENQIPHRKLGRMVRFDPDEIKRWWNGEQLANAGRTVLVASASTTAPESE